MIRIEGTYTHTHTFSHINHLNTKSIQHTVTTVPKSAEQTPPQIDCSNEKELGIAGRNPKLKCFRLMRRTHNALPPNKLEDAASDFEHHSVLFQKIQEDVQPPCTAVHTALWWTAELFVNCKVACVLCFIRGWGRAASRKVLVCLVLASAAWVAWGCG